MSKVTGRHFNLFFRLVCFLLVVTSFTCVAFARYISTRTTPSTTTINGVRGSIHVNRTESGSAFYNSDYIIGTTVMNQPYMTDFTLSNCNRDESGNLIKDDPAQVDLACEVVLYVPKELAMVAAFQITSVELDETGLTLSEKQITPIYTVAYFLSAADASTPVTMPRQTESAEKPYEDYGMMLTKDAEGKPAISETFSVTRGTSDEGLTLQAKQTNGAANVSLTIDEEKLNVSMTYTFQCFDKKMDGLSVPKLKSPLLAECEQEASFYKIRLSRPEFDMKGGNEHTTVYRLRVIPAQQLGNYSESNKTNELSMPFTVWYAAKTNPTFTYNGSVITEFGNGESFTVPGTGGTPETIYPNTCIAKDYPMRVNAIFTQTSIAPES